MSKPEALLLGGSGQLGTALRAQLAAAWTVIAPSETDVPLTDTQSLQQYIRQRRPAAVVNAAAFTRVDDAESQSELSYAINAAAPRALAEASADVGARVIHVSTDYVFDGLGTMPYAPEAPTHPLNVYGASKLAGEVAVLEANRGAVVVRTAWLHSGVGINFVGTAVRLLSAGRSMNVVDDQVGTPTRASTLAEAIVRMLERPQVTGIQHVTDAGVASWYDVACCVLDVLREEGRAPAGTLVQPVDSSAFPRPAARPKVSILDTYPTRAALAWTPPHWRDGVIASAREWIRAL